MTKSEREILELCNDALGAQYADIDDVSDAELRRVYMICKIAVFLEQNPDIKIFACRPDEGIYRPEVQMVDRPDLVIDEDSAGRGPVGG